MQRSVNLSMLIGTAQWQIQCILIFLSLWYKEEIDLMKQNYLYNLNGLYKRGSAISKASVFSV